MSFMDEIGKLAGGMLGGADPQEAATAASEHVQGMDAGQLGDHLTQSLGTMDRSSLSGLGQQLLQTFTNHAGYAGDANTATQEAGVSQAAVASGDPGAIGMLINMAKNNPGVLQSAAGSFLGNNPGAVGQLAPGLLQGILGRLGGR
ncbi:MAG: hypothetical protein NVS3B16_08750 [Vulcanimicrobiaceae bacterium]